MAKTIDHFMEAAAERVNEEIVAAQWFYPKDRWKNPTTVMRLVRGLVGRSRVDDRFPMMNVLIVTPTRVVVFAVENTYQNPMHLGDELASWPRSGITGTKERVELHTSGNNASRIHHQKFLRLSLQTPDGPLGVDLPTGDRHSQDVARALVG